MKTMKKVFVTLSLLFTYLSTCNNEETELIKANAETEEYANLITTPENPTGVAGFHGQFFGDNYFNNSFLDKNVANIVITNNKETFLSFDANHNSNIVAGYPQEAGATKEDLLLVMGAGSDTITYEEIQELWQLEFGIKMMADSTKDPRPENNSNQSFTVGAFLYENTDDETKRDLILYADADAIILEGQMFKDFEYLESINFEGCYTFGVSLHQMFSGCKSLKSIDLTGINFHVPYVYRDGGYHEIAGNGIEDFSNMFEGCTSLEEVNFPNIPLTRCRHYKKDDFVPGFGGYLRFLFDTDRCLSNYTQMFKDCTNLQRVNLSTDYVKEVQISLGTSLYNNVKEVYQKEEDNEFFNVPFMEMLFVWDNGKTENEIHTNNNEQYISFDYEYFAKCYNEIFAGCNNLSVVAFPSMFSLYYEVLNNNNNSMIKKELGLFINSNVENMIGCSLIGNIAIGKSVSIENIQKLYELYTNTGSIDTCNGSTEEKDSLFETYESLKEDPTLKNEMFVLNNAYYLQGIHIGFDENGHPNDLSYDPNIFVIKVNDKLNYMKLLSTTGKDTSQNNLITSIISNEYNAFIVIGVISLVSVGLYYIIKKKKIMMNN